MRRSQLLVFTTCYNERENIGRPIDQIVQNLPHADILVVDDNSPDGIWEIIQEKTATYPQLTSVKRPRKLGIGSAHKYALFYAMRESYKTLITMDADFSHDPKYLPKLLSAHGPGVFVTGSRYCTGGSSDYTGYPNIISRLGNLAARLALNIKLKELTTYYRVFDVDSLRRLPLCRVHAAGYSYGVQLIYYLRRAGVELREVPIHFTDRTHGASKIPRTQIMLSAVDLLKLAGKRLLRTRGYLIFRTTKQDEKHEHKAYGCNGLQSISSEKCAHDWNDMYACPGSHAASGLARAHHSETGRAMHGWMRLLGVLMQKPIVTMRDAFNPRRAGYGKYFGRWSGTTRVSERRNMSATNSAPFPDDESKARLFWARLLILDSIAR